MSGRCSGACCGGWTGSCHDAWMEVKAAGAECCRPLDTLDRTGRVGLIACDGIQSSQRRLHRVDGLAIDTELAVASIPLELIGSSWSP